MVYKLNVTDHADELLDNLVYHLIYRLKNKEAAKHLLDGVESIYDRLVENPYQFPKSRDMYLAKKGYYEAVIPQMNYIVIFDVRKDIVNIVGYTFGRELDRESLYYERFITHLKHFLARVVKNETYGKDANTILREVMEVSSRPDIIRFLFEKFYELLDSGEWKMAEEIIGQLEKEIGNNDPEINACRVRLELEQM